MTDDRCQRLDGYLSNDPSGSAFVVVLVLLPRPRKTPMHEYEYKNLTSLAKQEILKF